MPANPQRSFLDVPADHPFPIQNLPYCAFSMADPSAVHIGVRIGEFLLDLTTLEQRGLLAAVLPAGAAVFGGGTLNAFMALGKPVWSAVRARLAELLSSESPTLRDDAALRDAVLVPVSAARLHLPVAIGDYTDFYSSREHATNVGIMFRGKDNALQPNWLHLPVGYHGRASSVVLSGTDVRRPCGQTRPDENAPPVFGPSRAIDFELELGFFVGPGNALGEPISAARAAEHIFGFVLVNDWSARDIQRWEYVPLGPFLAKNFATTISPYVVPLAALEPFRCAGPAQRDPEPLEYLRTENRWAFDLHLEVALQPADSVTRAPICRTNFKYMYWNVCQQLAHHTITGCNMRPGDLLASGTISGPDPTSYGSMLELAWRGERPLKLPNGETRVFLKDHDSVIITGHAQGDGYRVGFGECVGRLLPAVAG